MSKLWRCLWINGWISHCNTWYSEDDKRKIERLLDDSVIKFEWILRWIWIAGKKIDTEFAKTSLDEFADAMHCYICIKTQHTLESIRWFSKK